MAGWAGRILNTTDSGITWVEQTSGTSANLASVSFASDALRGIVVGEGGTILRTPNGGQGGPPDITLSVNAYKFRGNYYADLTWTEATSSQMDIYRNGALIVTTENDGNYTDALRKQRKGTTFVYKVCEAGTQVCSNEATVVIRAH